MGVHKHSTAVEDLPCGLGHPAIILGCKDAWGCKEAQRFGGVATLSALTSWLTRGVAKLWLLPCLYDAEVASATESREPHRRSVLQELDAGAEAFTDLYAIGEKIGEGAFGKVYACSQQAKMSVRRDANLVHTSNLCVKLVPRYRLVEPLAATNEVKSRETTAEILELLVAFRHPNIVRYHFCYRSVDSAYIVMSKCDGPDLLDHVKACGGLLPLQAVRVVAQQIISALQALDEVQLMHRDLKSENLRFKDLDSGVIQLLDFGAAKVGGTMPGKHTVTGTLVFAAPEVFDGYYSSACDLWSAGVVVFSLIAGQLPFETADVTMLRSLHRDPVLTGDCLLRGDRWKKTSLAAQRFVRELLTVDASCRLSCDAAAKHAWLLGTEDCENAAELAPSQSPTFSPMKRCRNKMSLVELKRTCSNNKH